ncbi:MAG: HAMP domain-containing protein [Paracoccus denitrificans]|uniref:histidine kinase n=1 Tax=Paracoccus denitrificans TaxID=266 RepID=A0A533I954_PARDE|nr:MAG: HAMP domain-containing protein [Paracoccus denitrificans]
MTSLRARIAALLIAAILAVVGLATFAASRVLGPPDPELTIEPVARQIHVLADMAETAPDLLREAGGIIQPEPAGTEVLEGINRFLTHALRETGPARTVLVSRSDSDAVLIASVKLADGNWLASPIPDPSPPDNQWLMMGIWLSVIIAGSALVSLYAARRLSRPLELLEQAAHRIGADATLSPVPENGPAEVRATARALNLLSSRLSSAMESRMRLIAAAGHDLRTPMTRMRLRAEFVEDDDDRAKWLADLEELDRIADSAITLVREEVGGDAPQAFSLDDLLRDIAAELSELGQAVQLDQLDQARISASPLAMKRALRNLITNAATHGSGAELSLKRSGQDAVLSIRDNAPGIPDHLIAQVFEPFFRVDPARRKTVAGAGLGLAIAREIIERFGGHLTIRNRRTQGLIQTVKLPLTPEER